MYNQKILKSLNPRRILLYGVLIWFILYLFSPFKPSQELSLSWYSFIFLCFGLFYFGTIIPFNLKIKRRNYHEKIYRLFYFLLVLTLIGVNLKLYDRFILRGIDFSISAFDNREVSNDAAGNIIGILGSLLSPLSFHLLFLYLKYKMKFTRLIRVIIWFLPLIQIIDSIALGSRSQIFFSFIFIFLTLVVLNRISVNFKNSLKYISLFVLFTGIMQYLFIERTKEFIDEKKLKQTVLEDSAFNYTIKTSDKFHNYVLSRNDFFGDMLFTYSVTLKYYLHGMFELNYLMEKFTNKNTYGGYTFNLYRRMINKIFNIKNSTYDNILPRTGIYTSFLGPIYVDFSWLSPLFMFILGVYSRITYRKLVFQDDSVFTLYIFLAIVIFFFPVFNFIYGAGGLYYFTSFLLIKPLSIIKLRY